MAEKPLPRPAVARGYAAYFLSVLLDQHGPGHLVALQRRVESGRAHPRLLGQVTEMWADVRAAAQAWAEEASADGSAEVLPAEMAADSAEIDTEAAARRLGVSSRRVRQLATAGAIDARKVGRTWAVNSASVRLHQVTTRSERERF